MHKTLTQTLYYSGLALLALTSTTYGKGLVIQSVKNHTHHTAIVGGKHFHGSSNHNAVCVNDRSSKRDHISDTIKIRIDRRNYTVYNTEESCGKEKSNSKYFAIQQLGGEHYGKTCLAYMKGSKEDEENYDVYRHYHVANITFKQHTDSDGKTYYRPYLQYSNGDWCLEQENDNAAEHMGYV